MVGVCVCRDWLYSPYAHSYTHHFTTHKMVLLVRHYLSSYSNHIMWNTNASFIWDRA